MGLPLKPSHSIKRTCGGPGETKFPAFAATPGTRHKRRKTKTLADIALVFGDDCICELAANLPADSDLNTFAWWIREAAETFVYESSIPTNNEVRSEIASLHDAAERRACDELVRLREGITPEARAILGEALPAATDLRDDALRDEVAGALASLCRIGGRRVDGRRRSSGKRSSPSLRPNLYAPTASKNFLRREAERNFVERISIAWGKGTGKKPPRTARHADASRGIGPFARLVRECLRLVGAGYADPVALINEVGKSAKITAVQQSRINP